VFYAEENFRIMKNLINILIFIPFICSGQTIMVNGSPYLATQNNSFPFWLDAGSTLSTNPPMNFISVVEYNENEIEDDKNLGYSKVLSITESSVVPDGKVWKVISALQYHYEGCTDETMFNYDPQANVDNGSCEEIVEGCMSVEYYNYNSLANIDDGSCIEFVYGCIDEGACNFDNSANTDEGLCVYPDIGYNCEGILIAEVGESFFGGTIFHHDTLNKIFYVASENLGMWPWGCDNLDIQGANINPSNSFGRGIQNVEALIQNCNYEPTAALHCDEYEINGYDNWYLPSLFELEVIYDQIGDNYDSHWYWTSSQATDYTAYRLNFGSFVSQYFPRTEYQMVIAVRQHFY